MFGLTAAITPPIKKIRKGGNSVISHAARNNLRRALQSSA
jgi:hypothetical protein